MDEFTKFTIKLAEHSQKNFMRGGGRKKMRSWHVKFSGGVCIIFEVFIEYPLNLGSGCISMFSVNLTFDKTLVMQFYYF